MGDYISDVHMAFRAALERQNPEYRLPLRAANEAYANYVRVARASSSLGAKDGVFSPAQLGNAVRAGDASLRKMTYGKGGALLQDLSDAAQNVLPSNVPDSGTPERLGTAAVLGGAAYMEPHAIAATLAGAVPYTSPGMSMLRQWATALPALRQSIAAPIRQGAGMLAPSAATMAVGPPQ